jgi:hypothetical protein
MPQLDGTGPEGKGPGTGRGKGFCREDQKEYEQDQPETPKVKIPKKDK